MEFQAYPTVVPTGRKDVRAMLRLQRTLHSTDSMVLPATMLLISSLLITYQHFSDEDTSRTSVRNFLLKVFVSMAPLAILEFRVPKCADPVGLFAKFSSKVMMMHAAFLALRGSGCLWGVRTARFRFDVAVLLGVCTLLPTVFGIRPTRRVLLEHLDVAFLVAVSVLLAALEVRTFDWFNWSNPYHSQRLREDMICTSSDYIEILAFVPAVWMAHRKGGEAAEESIAQVSVSQKRALCLFAFLLVFYSMEDVHNAMSIWGATRAAALGHLIHYLLLLDFAGFLLAQLCDPARLQALQGSFMNWVTDVCAV